MSVQEDDDLPLTLLRPSVLAPYQPLPLLVPHQPHLPPLTDPLLQPLPEVGVRLEVTEVVHQQHLSQQVGRGPVEDADDRSEEDTQPLVVKDQDN